MEHTFCLFKPYAKHKACLELIIWLLLTRLTVAAHELVYATSCVNELRLTSVEGVRSVRDFELDQGISLALEFDGLLGCASRT